MKLSSEQTITQLLELRITINVTCIQIVHENLGLKLHNDCIRKIISSKYHYHNDDDDDCKFYY